MTVPGQGLSLITPHALLLIFLWRSRFVGALLRATRMELSFSPISAGPGRIAVPGWVARNGAPAGRAAGLSASIRGVERARPWPGTAMRQAGRIGDKLTQAGHSCPFRRVLRTRLFVPSAGSHFEIEMLGGILAQALRL